MMKLKKFSKIFTVYLFSLALVFSSYSCKKELGPSGKNGNEKKESSKLSGKVRAKVVRVIDGDTIVVKIPKTVFNDGEATIKDLKFTVRFVGVDTPESKENRRARLQAKENDTTVRVIVFLGKKAKEFTYENLFLGKQGRKKIYKEVYLEFDKEPQDHYGRLLAYIWLPDGRMLNEMLVCEGYAWPLVVKPNTKYKDRFQECYEQAKKEHKGLWKRTRR